MMGILTVTLWPDMASSVPRLHPNLAAIYKEKIANLVRSLNDPNTLIEANTAIRQLIERVQLVPENGELKIVGEIKEAIKDTILCLMIGSMSIIMK